MLREEAELSKHSFCSRIFIRNTEERGDHKTH